MGRKEGIGQTDRQTDRASNAERQDSYTNTVDGANSLHFPTLELGSLPRNAPRIPPCSGHCRYSLFKIFKFVCVIVNLRGGRVFYYAPLSASGFHCCRRLQRSSSPFSRLLSKVVEAICQSERRRQNVRPRHFNLGFRLAPCSSCFHFIQGVTWHQSRSRYQRISKY